MFKDYFKVTAFMTILKKTNIGNKIQIVLPF